MRTPPSYLLAFSLLTACGGSSPAPSDLRSRITSDLGNVLHETQSAADVSTANLPGGTAFGLASQALGGATGAARVLAPVARLLQPKTAGASVTGDTTTIDPDAEIQWLNDNLFTDANYLGNGIYKIPAELVCSTTSVDSNGTTTTAVDPTCAQQLAEAQIRIRVEQDNSTLQFAIQLDADHDEPLTILLSHDELSFSINLDDASHAMIALAQVFGEQAPNAALSGEVTADLVILGTAHAKLSLSFDRAISVKVADQGADLDGPAATRFASAAAQVIALELDGNAPLAKLDLGLGETTAHIPGDATSKSTDVDLAGATVNATFQNTVLTLANISLGASTTTIAKDGQQAIAIDLNANDGRKLDAAITADPTSGLETLTVSPRFDLQQSTDHAVLADTAPVYDVTRVQLDGSLRRDPATSQTEVMAGSFSIATSPAQYGFAATAGQCVTSSDANDAVSGQSYMQYAVGACI